MTPTRIIVIGASSVQGRIDPESGGWTGRLRKWHESNTRHNAVYNLGIGGNTTEDLLGRLKSECKARLPDLIIFSLGLNDARRIGSPKAPNDVSPEKFQANIKKLIKISKKITDVVFVGVYPINDKKPPQFPGKICITF